MPKFKMFNLSKHSMIAEKINVEIKLYPKKGIARVYDNIKPSKLYPYDPIDHTPKLVIM